LQHFDQVGFAEPTKYATCVSAGLLVVQVMVAVVAVILVAATFENETLEAVWKVLFAESIGVELPVGMDSTKKL